MTVKRAGLIYGLITGLITLLYAIFLLFIKKDIDPTKMSLVGFVILLISIIYTFLEFRRYNQNYITFREGRIISSFLSFFVGAGIGFFYYYIFTNHFELYKQIQLDQLEMFNELGFSKELIEESKKQITQYVSPVSFFFPIILGTLLQGLLLGTIITLILRKLPQSN